MCVFFVFLSLFPWAFCYTIKKKDNFSHELCQRDARLNQSYPTRKNRGPFDQRATISRLRCVKHTYWRKKKKQQQQLCSIRLRAHSRTHFFVNQRQLIRRLWWPTLALARRDENARFSFENNYYVVRGGCGRRFRCAWFTTRFSLSHPLSYIYLSLSFVRNVPFFIQDPQAFMSLHLL